MLDENRAFLVGICEDHRYSEDKQASLEELAKLADTAGVEVVGRRIQNRQAPDKTFFVGISIES